MRNFAKHVIEHGGSISPIIIPSELTNGTGTFNPSIFVDHEKIYLNVRHCQVTLYHSEKNTFEHEYGPLVYLNPENDITLTSRNFFMELDAELNMLSLAEVDMSNLNAKPLWEFVGLEDARIVKWDDKLFLCGVRRDTTTNGQGRIEMSEIEVSYNPFKVTEIARDRMPAPGDDSSYCEKNWMPVNDMPYHFVKWSNPTEVVKYDRVTKKCETVFLGDYVPATYDYRGGSNVIRFNDYYIAVSHTTRLFQSQAGRKNATYRHVLIVWDKNWNVVKYCEPFDFMGGEIEFCTGIADIGNDLVLTFGFQDNAAYMLRTPKNVIERLINE
jgi:hypothetical protein